jgi:hypothetical protein
VFKSFTLKWPEAVLFKIGLLALGIVIGSHWPNLFASYFAALIGLAAICLAYITYVWWKQ